MTLTSAYFRSIASATRVYVCVYWMHGSTWTEPDLTQWHRMLDVIEHLQLYYLLIMRENGIGTQTITNWLLHLNHSFADWKLIKLSSNIAPPDEPKEISCKVKICVHASSAFNVICESILTKSSMHLHIEPELSARFYSVEPLKRNWLWMQWMISVDFIRFSTCMLILFLLFEKKRGNVSWLKFSENV